MKNITVSTDNVIIQSNHKEIGDIQSLTKIGAGHDGIVYKYDELALKILKYDILKRKEKNLMTYEKALYFVNELNLKRITQPIDLISNGDGVYIGYIMKYLHDVTIDKNDLNFRNSNSFVLSDLFTSINDLEADVDQLSSKKIVMQDLNAGSYIVTDDYLFMCDMDKFQITNGKTTRMLNNNRLNFFISKKLYFEMMKSNCFTKEELRYLLKWVKCSSNSNMFLDFIRKDCLTDRYYPINNYAVDVGRMYLKK